MLPSKGVKDELRMPAFSPKFQPNFGIVCVRAQFLRRAGPPSNDTGDSSQRSVLEAGSIVREGGWRQLHHHFARELSVDAFKSVHPHGK